MTASGIISNTQDLWRQMIAACDAFQKWPDAGYPWDSEEALAHVWHDRLPPPASNAAEYTSAERAAYLPFCIVSTDPTAGFELETLAAMGEGGHYWQGSGVLVAEFYRAAPDPPDDETFRNFLGALLNSGNTQTPGLVELAATGGYLALTSLRVFGPVISVPEEYPEFGPVQSMMIVAKWS